MFNPSFEQPILNSPWKHPGQPWELDSTGYPTQQNLKTRRRAEGGNVRESQPALAAKAGAHFGRLRVQRSA